MTPTYMIKHYSQDGSESDITAQLKERLISLTITDQSGFQSDQIVLVLDDTDGKLSSPNTNTNIKVWLGYKEDGDLTPMGEFTIAQVEYSGFPQRMTITATSANMNTSLKSVKSRSFIDKTLQEIVDQIAQENGYVATVGKDVADKKYTHIDQIKESDMNFLTRIAKDIDCVCKFMQNRILFIKNATAQTASGRPLPPITLDLNSGKVLDFSVVYNQRQVYNTVFAEYHDFKAAKLEKMSAGSGEPTYTIPIQYKNGEEATEAAIAQLNYFKRHIGQMSIKLIGDSSIMSQFPLSLINFKSSIDLNWIIQKAVHTYTPSSGFLTQLEAIINPNPTN